MLPENDDDTLFDMTDIVEEHEKSIASKKGSDDELFDFDEDNEFGDDGEPDEDEDPFSDLDELTDDAEEPEPESEEDSDEDDEAEDDAEAEEEENDESGDKEEKEAGDGHGFEPITFQRHGKTYQVTNERQLKVAVKKMAEMLDDSGMETLTIDGQEVQMRRSDVFRSARTIQAADRRMRDRMEQVQELSSKLEQLNDPIALLLAQGSEDPVKELAGVLAPFVKYHEATNGQLNLNPQQYAQLMQQVQGRMEQARKAVEGVRSTVGKYQAMEQQELAQLGPQMPSALEAEGLGVNDLTRALASAVYDDMKASHLDVSAPEIAARTRSLIDNHARSRFSNLKGKALLSAIGNDILGNVKTALAEQAANQDKQKRTQAANNKTPKQKKKPESKKAPAKRSARKTGGKKLTSGDLARKFGWNL